MKAFYFYRIPNRTVRWLCFALMSAVILFILSLIRMSYFSSRQLEALRLKDKPPLMAPWESFDFLHRYFAGIRTLVPRSENVPEYPRDSEATPLPLASASSTARSLPSSVPLNPYPDYNSSEYIMKYGSVNECFLDAEGKIRVPKLHTYSGVPRGQPDAIMGSYEIVGLSDSMCFERYGRLGPYGFGYSVRRGGTGAGLVGEREGADEVWQVDQEVDYNHVQWGEAQRRCFDKNNHRFRPHSQALGDASAITHVERSDNLRLTGAEQLSANLESLDSSASKSASKYHSRTAIVVRTMWDFQYTQEDVLYLRTLIAELSLASGGEYTVHFLIHVKDDNLQIWADPDIYTRALEDALPKEFHGMATLWSERQMGLIYGGLAESYFRDLPVHGVYRSTFMPVQYFAYQHPEYDYYWNWEMDIRYTGHWYHLFENLRAWAQAQPRKGLWERNGRFYIPSIHGTWEDFKQMVRVQSEMTTPNTPTSVWSGGKPGPRIQGQGSAAPLTVDKPVWGPLAPEDVFPIDDDPTPPISYEKDKYAWGVGEEADLITLSPMFDPDGTTWLLAEDVTGYNTTEKFPPRRAAIIAASRMSRRLLLTMHKEVALQRHTMFSEMWPASCALHHGLKAVYVPHPVFIDRNWPTNYLASVMNGGKNGASGGARTSVYGEREHNFLGTTWYYNSGFSGNLWRRWLGYRVDNDGGEEEELAGEGRMCLPGVLLHPVKGVQLVIEGVGSDDTE